MKLNEKTLAMHAVGSAIGGIVAWKYVGGFWATLGGIILGGWAGGGVGGLIYGSAVEVSLPSSSSGTPITAATLADSTNDAGDRWSMDPWG